jgi:hypothetical protein
MKRTIAVLLAGMAAVLFLWSQQRDQSPPYLPFEVFSVFPREVSPGIYAQVEQRQLQTLSDQGWELVGVTPYIYRNEEHGEGDLGRRQVVTQTYPAYFFRRVKVRR